MNISIIGVGKLGSMVLQLNQNHSISYQISRQNAQDIELITPQNTDVVIHTATPETVLKDATVILAKKIPMVIATTGFDKEALQKLVQQHDGKVVQDGNFSVGVNVMYLVNEYLASLMEKFKEYDVCIHETHHNLKKDAPSGTAIQLAEGILKQLQRKKTWSLPQAEGAIHPEILSMSSNRVGSVIGEHTVMYDSVIDELSLSHKAKNRHGFAQGILMACEFIATQPHSGMYTMRQVLL